jgi:predicted DNA-binding transcriptional regulator AlpA
MCQVWGYACHVSSESKVQLAAPNLAGVGELVMAAEIAQMFGVSRQAVHLWYQQRARSGFPEPVDVVKAGAIWRTADVVEWARSRGREIQEEQ